LVKSLGRPAIADRGTYDYSTFGYVLLGRVIEQVTGEAYAAHCARQVLEPAGIGNAELHRQWGIRYAVGGWALSGREYLAFLRRLADAGTWLGDEVWQWATDPTGKPAVGARSFYSLGVMVRRSGPQIEISHSGALYHNQPSAFGGSLFNSTHT